MSNRTLRLILAVIFSPSSVALTLANKGKNPFSHNFWINFALMIVPIPGTAIIHALWFLSNQGSNPK